MNFIYQKRFLYFHFCTFSAYEQNLHSLLQYTYFTFAKYVMNEKWPQNN